MSWPRTLFARLAVIIVVGMLLAQTLSFWVTLMERNQVTATMMMGYVEREVASSVALLDHLPAGQRAQWLPGLARRSYSFILGPGSDGPALDAALSARVAESINTGIGKSYALRVNAIPGQRERFQVHLNLSDGSPLTIDVRPVPGAPLSPWLPLVLAAQLVLLAASCWMAVRMVTRPLLQLASAADTLGPDLKAARLPEDGPAEVAHAARAFNAMQARIGMYMSERIELLAAISHDLQTPITRMRLRLDLMDEDKEPDKLRHDLAQMEALVREGVDYARTLHGTAEQACRVDVDGLLDTIACDYTDAGHEVAVHGTIGAPLHTRPLALRRVVGNLVDNALHYAGAAEIRVGRGAGGALELTVADRGPGIPPEFLDTVFTPFYRLESSRNRDTGGTGLGLAIARQLTLAMGGELTLANRAGGGLEAKLTIRPAAR